MKKRKYGLAIGLPTIVNLLVLTAFSCLSMLSLSRAKIDYMAATHGFDVTRDYFSADSRAQQSLAQLMQEAGQLPPAAAGAEMEATLNDQGIAARYESDTQLLRFALPAGEAGTLSLEIRLTAPGAYEIATWRLMPHEAPDTIN